MFKPAKMEKVALIATKNSESRLISALHKLGVVEIRASEIEGLEKGRPLEIHDAVSRELVRVRALINAFGATPAERKHEAKAHEPEYSRTLSEASRITIDEGLKALVDARANLISETTELEKKKAEISKLSGFSSIDFSKLETRNFTFAAGTVNTKSLPQFRKDLSEYLHKEGEVLHIPDGKDSEAVLIFYPRKENISFLLSRYNFEKIQLPVGFSTFASGMGALDNSIRKTRQKIAETEKRISEMKAEHLPTLSKLEKELSLLSTRAAISTKFSLSRKIIAIEGWTKKKDVARLEHMLKKDFAAEAELMPLGDDEHAPIVLENPKQISQFQWLVEFYSLPSYMEFDPTFLLLFTVPIIYGMIVGDVGYGIMSIFLSMLILRKFKGGMLGNIASIWLFSSISAIVFGVVFDEWFGFTHMHLLEWLKEWGVDFGIGHPLYEGLSRSHNLSLVIGLTLLVGIAHLSMGFILGAINTWHHERKHAYAKIAWLTLLLSGSTAVAAFMFNLVPQEFGTPALALAAISGAIITYLEGLPGLFEIPGLAANTFSYARIAAAGVAGVIIAEIINESLLPTPEKSILLIPVFFILHTLNAALAMFESIVQGGRLNLVEFYSKFFHGGGKAFDPFTMEEKKG